MVEIHANALFVRKLRVVFVIVILLQDGDVTGGQRLDDAASNRRLAGTGTAADPDDEWPLAGRVNGGLPSRFEKRFSGLGIPFCTRLGRVLPQWRITHGLSHIEDAYFFFLFFVFFSSITAWAAARRAIGTRKGDALT
jgi:hypothetical protein